MIKDNAVIGTSIHEVLMGLCEAVSRSGTEIAVPMTDFEKREVEQSIGHSDMD